MKLKRLILLCTIILAAALIIGCGGGEAAEGAKDGDKVAVHYTGTLSDGSVFDSSAGREPLEFVMGAGNMIPGFENAVRGMKAGESKTVTLSPDEAYGEYREDMVLTFSREEIPEGLEVEVGQQLPLKSDSGATVIATIIDISEENLILDANHKLAGKELTFEIELIRIETAE